MKKKKNKKEKDKKNKRTNKIKQIIKIITSKTKKKDKTHKINTHTQEKTFKKNLSGSPPIALKTMQEQIALSNPM